MLERGGSVRPFHDEDRSRELTCAISSVRNVSDSTDLAACLQRLFQASGNTPEYVKNYGKEETDVECWPFSGLAVFLDEIAHVDERDNFFAAVLPFVVWLASRAPELIPEEGIPVGTQQNGEWVSFEPRDNFTFAEQTFTLNINILEVDILIQYLVSGIWRTLSCSQDRGCLHETISALLFRRAFWTMLESCGVKVEISAGCTVFCGSFTFVYIDSSPERTKQIVNILS